MASGKPADDRMFINNNICPDRDYLKITPFEHVPLETEWDPRDLDISNILKRLRYWSATMSEHVSILKCEQKWIKKLKSRKPYGMNKHKDLPPPGTTTYHIQFKIHGQNTCN